MKQKFKSEETKYFSSLKLYQKSSNASYLIFLNYKLKSELLEFPFLDTQNPDSEQGESLGLISENKDLEALDSLFRAEG